MENQILSLIETLEYDCKEIREMIIERIESAHFSDDDLKDALLKDPFTIELSLECTELDQMHSYDLGRLEAFEEILRELKRINK